MVRGANFGSQNWSGWNKFGGQKRSVSAKSGPRLVQVRFVPGGLVLDLGIVSMLAAIIRGLLIVKCMRAVVIERRSGIIVSEVLDGQYIIQITRR